MSGFAYLLTGRLGGWLVVTLTSCRFLQKSKGLQLALEPLDGQGIAGYVPEP